MANATVSLDERLSAPPQLKERVEAIRAIVEDSSADGQQADEAERRVIAEVRRVGNEALCSWAARQERVQSTALMSQQGAVRAGKKNSTGIRRLGKLA
jgi:histidinol dehydrogenase